ncbi:uncharacterized protein Pyn_03847 [Prunus yedoensis var. nudiflora]|uniref:Uncharacterized protein n=1 Tax=Prunus yedoensis var. nudiflora TaxID=2094558 RepID=A0A314XK52_PRUYE|nr:uncharacterized protein Pyn_03847 [Prunus yedoensis var. nudiflora]
MTPSRWPMHLPEPPGNTTPQPSVTNSSMACLRGLAGAEVYLPNFVARQFGLIQTTPLPPPSTNRLSSWKADVFQLQQGMTFLTLTPWSRCNAYDEDGRVWYEECISVTFIRPIEEAAKAALKNADWDPLTPKGSKVKKVSAGPSRPSTPAVAVPKVTAPPLARTATVAPAVAPSSTVVPARRGTPVAGARKTLAHRTVPTPLPARPTAVAASGRKGSREAPGTEAAPAQSAVAEMATPQRAEEEDPFYFLGGQR